MNQSLIPLLGNLVGYLHVPIYFPSLFGVYNLVVTQPLRIDINLYPSDSTSCQTWKKVLPVLPAVEDIFSRSEDILAKNSRTFVAI